MNEEAVLITIKNTTDDDGFPVEKPARQGIYVRKKSATRTEFYDALRSGVRVSIVFEVRVEDFEHAKDATRIEYAGKTYDIVRTYQPDKSMIELVCS